MSIADQDEVPWTLEDCVSDSQPQTDGNSTSVRRSARLAVRTPESPCIALWPITKILGVLFSLNIHAPLGASHEELLHFLIANVPDIATAPAMGIPASTPPAPRKASSKRKHCAPPATSSAAASAPAKRARLQSQGAIPQQTEDPILAALSNIQTSSSIRIQNLEDSPSATRFSFNEPGIGASSAATYDANPAPSNLAIEPRRTMGTAIPAAPVGVPFFPPAAAISPHLRAQILAEQVFEKLWKHGLKLQPHKCKLFQTKVKYLGHVVSKDGVATDPEKTSAVQQWKPPTTV
ncbi:hypothetical protein SKAU_G00236570 [Synaphobranchus kaupii]|uniref:Uncharacterized protein n=1 Tax=Synaphobranchus kaupii TaxID=118154 RepID=A0A9Q1ITX1_SYNKA|nr:hypothetical protein SKAU_G00236570 [Synaphobranchus kaupii]